MRRNETLSTTWLTTACNWNGRIADISPTRLRKRMADPAVTPGPTPRRLKIHKIDKSASRAHPCPLSGGERVCLEVMAEGQGSAAESPVLARARGALAVTHGGVSLITGERHPMSIALDQFTDLRSRDSSRETSRSESKSDR
jgi:hypothetical protein